MIIRCSDVNVEPLLTVAGIRERGELKPDISPVINDCRGGWLSFLVEYEE